MHSKNILHNDVKPQKILGDRRLTSRERDAVRRGVKRSHVWRIRMIIQLSGGGVSHRMNNPEALAHPL